MTQFEIEELGLKYREEVELEDIVVAHVHVNNRDIFKLFASKIKKKGGATPVKETKEVKQTENKKDN